MTYKLSRGTLNLCSLTHSLTHSFTRLFSRDIVCYFAQHDGAEGQDVLHSKLIYMVRQQQDTVTAYALESVCNTGGRYVKLAQDSTAMNKFIKILVNIVLK